MDEPAKVVVGTSISPHAPWVIPGGCGALLLLDGLVGTGHLLDVLAVAVQAVFLVYFVRHFAFVASALGSVRADLVAPALDVGFRPPISILVACKNEEAVVEGLVTSLLALEYPLDRLQVLVVDDGSDDRTGELLDEIARREPRLSCVHRRQGATGGKSGALNEALPVATGEVIVVFDADHQPRPDVLWRLARHFQDPSVAAVQGRCEIRNPSDTPLTQLVAIDYMAGYLVNEYGRQSVFRLPAYGGANCAVRASVLRELGGWNPATVTEDTDLTMRMMLSGRRVRYDVTAVDEEEGVVTFGRYWRQRYRWARGHQQAWRDYLRAVLDSPALGPLDKLESTLFLLAFHLPVLSGLGIGVLVAWLAHLGAPVVPGDLYVFWLVLFLGPLLELGSGLLLGRADRRWALSIVFFLPLFLTSVALCTKAWVDGLLGRPYSWVKTKRAGDTDPRSGPAAVPPPHG